MPDLQRSNQAQHRDSRRRDHVDGLSGNDDRALFDSVRGDPADQDECDEGCAPAGRHDRQRHRDCCRVRSPEGPAPPRTCRRRRSTTTQRPSAGCTRGTGTERARAIGRRRPPASECRFACSHRRWSLTGHGRVHRISVRRDRRNGATHSHKYAQTLVWADLIGCYESVKLAARRSWKALMPSR